MSQDSGVPVNNAALMEACRADIMRARTVTDMLDRKAVVSMTMLGVYVPALAIGFALVGSHLHSNNWVWVLSCLAGISIITVVYATIVVLWPRITGMLRHKNITEYKQFLAKQVGDGEQPSEELLAEGVRLSHIIARKTWHVRMSQIAVAGTFLLTVIAGVLAYF